MHHCPYCGGLMKRSIIGALVHVVYSQMLTCKGMRG